MLSKAATPASTGKQPVSLRVLIVDDDDFQLDYISELLQTHGVPRATQAASGSLALAAMGRDGVPFDLIIVDLYMPDMDGFQFMEEVAKKGYAGALVIASGQRKEILHSAALVAQLRRFNFLGTVSKPVSKSDLNAILQKVCA